MEQRNSVSCNEVKRPRTRRGHHGTDLPHVGGAEGEKTIPTKLSDEGPRCLFNISGLIRWKVVGRELGRPVFLWRSFFV